MERGPNPVNLRGPLAPGVTRHESYAALIERAAQRSSRHGLQRTDPPDLSLASAASLRSLREQSALLCRHALPAMETLYQQIANTQSMVLLTARGGQILHALGDADFLARAARVALQPGADWSEQSKGTNAIGSALAEGQALVVHGDQHFLDAHRFLSCSCTPIVDPYGAVLGALDVTSEHSNHHQHTMALVRMSAQMVENQMFADVFAHELVLRFHARPEFLGTLMEGIAVFAADGTFLSANRSAAFQLGLSPDGQPVSHGARAGQTLQNLMGLRIGALRDQLQRAAGHPIACQLHNGVTVYCVGALAPHTPWRQVAARVPDVAPGAALARSAPRTPREAPTDWQDLHAGDPTMARIVDKLQRVRGRDIPILLLGETGTGKDWLAQAIHADAPWAKGPFVSVNCAAIPENLIESELFGYTEGAFTGARRKGAIGKIQSADGGTLFLDEIGDMPRSLQARLLRVLQERCVTPLGADHDIPVRFALVCATHKDLRAMIADGSFREDLYYRLNGLVLRLPALRERHDLLAIAQRILRDLCAPAAAPAITPAVIARWRNSDWPGNFRQLFNLLQTAIAMRQGDEALDLQHLPDDFLDALPPPKPSTPHTPPAAPPAADPRTAWSGPLLAQALAASGGNVSAAARRLGISRNTFYRKQAAFRRHTGGA